MAGPPPASSAGVRRRMQVQPRRDTRPEIALRKALHELGARYRLDMPVVPGTRRRVDIAFTRAKVAAFVDGCFWHCCPVHGTRPLANADWWVDKLAHNVARDRDTDARLVQVGWTVVRAWEHDDMAQVAGHVASLVRLRCAPL